jgi:ribonuclease Z
MPVLFSALVCATCIAGNILNTASAQDDVVSRDNYFPNTEELTKDEMRVIALGTGTPNFRRSQASAAWLVELGNGEKFIFDIGTGSLANLAALEIPYSYLDKIFISHLHVDHIGDLDAMFIGGWVSNRTGPLRVWGPNGKVPETGTKYAVNRMLEMYTWDLTNRRGNMPSSGGHIEVTEFDYSKSHVIYEQNGVKISSWPAVHGIDGAISYSLEYAGKKFVYSGDTVPNKWFFAEARDADLLIHECYLSIQQFIDLKHYDPERARIVATVVHTPPSSCGKIFAQLEPRMAVAYHTFNDYNTAPDIIEGIRETYDGPLTLADDMLVWNIDTDNVRVRRVIATDEPWPAAPPQPAGPPDPSERTELSDWLNAGRVDLLD